MKNLLATALCFTIALVISGCSGDVESTDDSIKIEAEVPKLETGDEPLDLDPRTDDDLDIDTPLEGDR